MIRGAGFFLEAVLRRLARFACAWPKSICVAHTVFFIAAVLFTVDRLEFHTDRNDLVGTDRRYHRNFLAFQQQFDARDEIVVVVESASPETNRQFVERLGARMNAEPALFEEVLLRAISRRSARARFVFWIRRT